MKKFIVLGFVFLFLLFQLPTSISAHSYDTDISFNVTDNSRYALTTGIYYTDNDWARTDKQSVSNNNIIVDSISLFNHLLVWDEANNYLGYYNSPLSSEINSKYLGSISSTNFYITGEGKTIAFDAHLTETITDIYIDTIYGSQSLLEMFGNSNELSNGSFDSGLEGWSRQNVTYDSINHQAALNTAGLDVFLLQFFNATNTHIYYLTFEAYTNQQATLILGTNYFGEEEDIEFTISLPLVKTRYAYRFQNTYVDEGLISFSDGGYNSYVAYLDNIKLIDMTAFFGSGNEPSLTTLNTLYNQYLELPITTTYITLNDFTNLSVISSLWIPNVEESIPNWLKSIGLTEGFGQVIFALILVGGMALLLTLLKAPRIIVILLSLITLFLTIALGLLPTWIIFVIGIIVFIMIILGRTQQ